MVSTLKEYLELNEKEIQKAREETQKANEATRQANEKARKADEEAREAREETQSVRADFAQKIRDAYDEKIISREAMETLLETT